MEADAVGFDALFERKSGGVRVRDVDERVADLC